MSVTRKVSPLEVMKVFAKEHRIRRIQARRQKLRGKINDLFAQIRELEDEDEAWSDRENELTWSIEQSGVYDD